MWISEVDEKVLRTWIEHCPVCKLVSTADGGILYANDAFREWIGYTLSELKQLGWKKISVDDDSLEADMKAVIELQDGYHQTYKVQKQYIPKNGKPEWGVLTVMRYPPVGDIKCFLCTFEPLKNGTQAAFSMAMDRVGDMAAQIGGLRTEVAKLTTQDEETTWINSSIRMIRKHPRAAAAIFAMMLSIFGANNILELMQRLGLVQVPVPVKAVANPEATALNINDKPDTRWTLTTVDGNVIEIPSDNLQDNHQWFAKPKSSF